jgi:uncharacterized protein YqiB (DUF1249 family)
LVALTAFSPQPQPTQSTRVDSSPPPGVVDGSKTPTAIPYEVAYLHLCRLLANTAIPKEVRADALAGSNLTSSEIDKVIAAASEFERATKNLDAEATAIKNAHWPQPSLEVLRTLEAMDQQRNAILTNVLTSLRSQIGIDASQRLAFFVEMNFIPKIRLVPSRILSGNPHH